MHTVAIIQARMGSTRLPGKVLADVCGRPLLARVIERARAIQNVDRVVVATTAGDHDRSVLEVARQHGVDAFAGNEDDVLDRFYQAAKAYCAQMIVRLTADCPLLDPGVSGRVVAVFSSGAYDYVSNTLTRTFPDGLDTEVFSFAALDRAWTEAGLVSEREHVTPYIWKHPEHFRVANVSGERDLSEHRWTVDEPRDLEFVRAVYAKLGEGDFGMAEVLGLLASHPELSTVNAGITLNEGYLKSLREDRLVG